MPAELVTGRGAQLPWSAAREVVVPTARPSVTMHVPNGEPGAVLAAWREDVRGVKLDAKWRFWAVVGLELGLTAGSEPREATPPVASDRTEETDIVRLKSVLL